jgi:capsular exopolysaccharide synthesis family protein
VAFLPGSVQAPHVREAFQTLRAGLTYFNIDRTLGSVLVASPKRGDGKTTVAANLALALAQDDRDVILVDCDLRRPQLARRLGVEDQVNFGLDAVLVDRRPLADAIVEIDVDGEGSLQLLPGGSPPPNPSVLLGSDRLRAVLAKLSDSVEMVIIDTPPLLAVSDAIPLQEQVSGTVLIARMDSTSRDGVRKASAVISSAGGNLLGFVATGVRTGGIAGHDTYDYGYGYAPEVAENGAGPDGAGRRFPFGRRARSGSGESA